MLFSSNIFLYIFLPLCLLLYYVAHKKYRNYILLVFSLAFYAWGEPVYIVLMLLSITLNYFLALLIDHCDKNHLACKRAFLVLTVIVNLLILGYYKYSGFIAANINRFTGFSLPVPEIALPIGISFFTFQAMSYVFDVYKKSAAVQKNPLYVALYISLFPQLIAGPIVRYDSIALQIEERQESLELFSAGAQRFVIGLSKKVLLSNGFAALADMAFDGGSELSIGMAWLGAISYTFQIYFDFSGYSDMAIGLGKIFGFQFCENFNYPYISKSVTEFWRRWHISLSTWFRDYVYIPLGGNRKGLFRQVVNLAIVWFLTGLWHGAGWTFITWGLLYFILLMIEKAFLLKVLNRLPIINHLYTLLAVSIGWVFFRAPSIPFAIQYISTMFGGQNVLLFDSAFMLQLTQNLTLFIIGILASLPLAKILFEKIQLTINNEHTLPLKVLFYTMVHLGFVILFLLCGASLASNEYNPFIYFNF